MSTKRSVQVQSLIQQCQSYIVMHLEEFPINHLSLLPLFTRKDLLWQLPLADVCHLEGTKFAKGLDMAAYWKFLWGDQIATIINPTEDRDVERYIQQKWPSNHDNLEYSKAMLYGQLATCAIGCLDDDFVFCAPHDGECEDIFDFLFAVRKIQEFPEGLSCCLEFPPRYSHKIDISKEELMQELVNCFKGELPTVLAEIFIYRDVELDYTHFLKEVVYMGVHGLTFEAQFIKAVIQEATQLEVLILEGFYDEDEPVPLDEFCTYISAHPTFWSRFQLLKVLSATIPGHGYTVSQEIFDKLISTYFSASTDHTQKVQFTDMTILSTVFYDSGPTIDQR